MEDNIFYREDKGKTIWVVGKIKGRQHELRGRWREDNMSWREDKGKTIWVEGKIKGRQNELWAR